MKVAVMQPYFLPYIGYWQLMNVVDVYVVFDDVNYIKGGWINRNRILLEGKPHYITIPLIGASQNKLINEILIDVDSPLLKKQLRTVNLAYRRAPRFEDTYMFFADLISGAERNLTSFILRSFSMVRNHLRINSKLILSSEIEKDNTLKGQDKIISICKAIGADEYINAIGGKELYEVRAFEENGIKLKFLHTDEILYSQLGDAFQPNLSILDMMMFLSDECIAQMLKRYTLE